MANVDCVSIDALMRRLAAPTLTRRGHRPAPACVDREALHMAAADEGGWLAEITSDAADGILDVQRAVTELRRCPEPTIDAFTRRAGRVGALARLVVAAGGVLRAGGFADAVEADGAAVDAAAHASGRDALATVVCIDVGTPRPTVRRVLGLLDRPDTHDAAGAGAVRHVTVGNGDTGTPKLTDLHTCADPDEEMRSAVRVVVAALERGVALRDIAVVHPPGTGYARMAHQHLAAAGIPLAGPPTTSLERSVPGRMLLGLLDLARGDWGRAEVMAWLSSGPVAEHAGGPVVAAADWDALSARAGVVGGAAQWRTRLAAWAARADAAGDATGAHQAEALARFVSELAAATSPPSAGWAAHAAWAASLLDRYLAVDSGAPLSPASQTAAVRAAVLGLGDLDALDAPVDTGALRRALRHTLGDGDPGGADESLGYEGVFVAAYGCARGMRFDTVVVVGLAGASAGAVCDDPVLPDALRRLDASGGLRTRAERVAEERDDVTAAVATGTTRRIATVPRHGGRSGRVTVPSPWLEPLISTRTRLRSSPSFAASISSANPALSRPELELRDTVHWVGAGRDGATAPLARTQARLRIGIGAVRARAGERFTRFDGALEPGVVSAFAADAPVSPTRLETYVRCPRRFLFDRVLGIRREPLPEERWQMEPSERGTLVHAILEDYVAARLQGAPRSLERLLDAAEVRFAAAEAAGLVGKPLLWRMDRATVRRDLTRFYAEEGDLEPLAAELQFGTDAPGADPPVSVAVGGGDGAGDPARRDGHAAGRQRFVHFKGTADRVDRAPSGELVVSDYKTGAQRGLSDLARDPVAGGRLLQLPIYALAAQARFGGAGPVRARYWLLSESRSAPWYSVSVTDAVDARFRDVVGLIADAIESGAFPGAPAGRFAERRFDACRFCDFDRVCPPTPRPAVGAQAGCGPAPGHAGPRRCHRARRCRRARGDGRRRRGREPGRHGRRARARAARVGAG